MINSMNKCHESAFQSWKWQTGSTTPRSEEPERNPFEGGREALPEGRYLLVLGRWAGSDQWASSPPQPFSGDPLLESLATEHMARSLVRVEHVGTGAVTGEPGARSCRNLNILLERLACHQQAGATRGTFPRSKTELKV